MAKVTCDYLKCHKQHERGSDIQKRHAKMEAKRRAERVKIRAELDRRQKLLDAARRKKAR